MHLLDTDTLTHLYHAHAAVVERLNALLDPDVGITVISKIEMLLGRYDFLLKAANGLELLRAQELLNRTEKFLSRLLTAPVNEKTTSVFDQLSATKKMKKLGRKDLLIACIALGNKATLVTRNLRHFKQVPGLSLENWLP